MDNSGKLNSSAFPRLIESVGKSKESPSSSRPMRSWRSSSSVFAAGLESAEKAFSTSCNSLNDAVLRAVMSSAVDVDVLRLSGLSGVAVVFTDKESDNGDANLTPSCFLSLFKFIEFGALVSKSSSSPIDKSPRLK